MDTPLTTNSHAILGLLAITPMSGYDLHLAVERAVGRFWPISKSQVYAELPRLQSLGLIEGREVRQRSLPDKRVFQLTEAGEQALDAWLASDQDTDPQFRIPFLLKVLFGHRSTPGDTAAVLRGVRDRARDQAAQYAGYLKLLQTTPDSGYAQATVLFGLRVAEAITAWAQEAQVMLPEHPPRLDPRREPRTAAALLLSAPSVRSPSRSPDRSGRDPG